MNGPNRKQLFIDRILVAVDSSTEQLRTLEAAADLAALLQADLFALFVEDPRLLQLEELPSTRRINLPQGFGSEIEKGSMERELRALARRSEQIIARASEQRRVNWSFRVVRGSLVEQLRDVLMEGDLVVAESAGRSIRFGMRMKPPTRQAAQDIEGPVLFLQHGPRPTRSVVAVYDGGYESEAVLEAAVRLIGGPVTLLTVLLPAESREEADELQDEADAFLSQEGIPAHFRRIAPDSVEWVVNALDALHGDILVQGASSRSLQDGGIDALLESVDCPVLLIR